MRSIQVSTDVFAAIWAARMEGEDTEEAILRRLLGVKAVSKAQRDIVVTTGFVDPRFNVVIPPGFEIFRTYLGKDYSARAIGGLWILSETGVGYATLNELSNAIGASKENAWAAWFWMDGKVRRAVSDLRDPARIVSRSKRRALL